MALKEEGPANSPIFWQTRAVEFDRAAWVQLLPKRGLLTAITPQFGADVVAIVWGKDAAQETANAKFIVKAVNSHDVLMSTLGRVKADIERVAVDLKTDPARAHGLYLEICAALSLAGAQ